LPCGRGGVGSSHTLRWYFVSLVFRFEPAASRAARSARKSQPVEETWELYQAISRAGACAKAKKVAKVACATPSVNLKTGEKGRWALVGIKECWLVYDDLTDGADIAWFQHGRMTAEQVRRLMGKRPSTRG
jgi:hypothetical protein